MRRLQVRPAGPQDAAALADIHSAALPDDVLPRLGRNFLQNVFYPLVLGHGDTDCIVAGDGPCPDGLLVLARAPQALTAALAVRRHRILAALVCQGWRAAPLALDMLCAARGRVRELNVAVETYRQAWEIYILAVHPRAQGRGLGSALVAAALARLAAPLLIVKTASETAKGFYEGNGFRPAGLEQRGRRTIWLLGAQPVSRGPSRVPEKTAYIL